MKIAIFSDNFYPELSGISDSIITTGRELASRGHEINFFVPYYSPRDYQTAGHANEELDLGKNIIITRLFSFHYPGPTKQTRVVIPRFHYLKRLKRFKPDIIHTQLFFGAGLDATYASKKLNIPLVGTNHTAVAEFVRYAPIKFEWLKSFALRYVANYYNKCSYVTAPSQSVFAEMIPFGFKSLHRALSNPVDTKTFGPAEPFEKEELKKEFGLTGVILVFAGRLSPEKNIDYLIKGLAEAKKTLPNIMLALAGRGSGEEALRSLAQDLGVEKDIKFMGNLDKFMLAKLFKASDIFTIMSESETQNMSLMQALASGLPAIGARARALPEYINIKHGFLVGPGDINAFSQKLVELAKNEHLRLRMGDEARNFASNFSTKNIAGEWERIYKDNLKK